MSEYQGPAVPIRATLNWRRWRALAASIGSAIGTLLLISIISFGAMSRAPENVARNVLGRDATQSQLDDYVQSHGLNRPLAERYAVWLTHFTVGDWGTSLVSGNPVNKDVVPRLVTTLILALSSIGIALPLGLITGVYMALRIGRWPDLTLSLVTVVITAVPDFVTAISLLLLFGMTLGWLPVDSVALMFSSTASEKAAVFALPIITLAISIWPYISRITRAAAREALAASYTQAALLRGLPRRTVVWNHAMRNAAISIINAVSVSLVYLIGGVIVVENVFGMPGIGRWLVEAVSTGDAPAVQAVAVIMGAIFIGVNLIADMVMVYFNPRYRYSL
jgi:peptide/nickel transport system permease protein